MIVSPQIAGQLIHLNVDEGSDVKKGDLIGEIFPAELASTLASAEANIKALEAKVGSVSNTRSLTDGQTQRVSQTDQRDAHLHAFATDSSASQSVARSTNLQTPAGIVLSKAWQLLHRIAILRTRPCRPPQPP